MNSRISSREHARLARELIEACGGLDEARRNCRITSKSTLSDYQSPHLSPTMPADVIADLELYCGKAIYSSVLAERFNALTVSGSIRDFSCQLTEVTAELQGTIRRAIADGQISANEHNAIDEAIDTARDALAKLEAAKRAVETAGPKLKAV